MFTGNRKFLHPPSPIFPSSYSQSSRFVLTMKLKQSTTSSLSKVQILGKSREARNKIKFHAKFNSKEQQRRWAVSRSSIVARGLYIDNRHATTTPQSIDRYLRPIAAIPYRYINYQSAHRIQPFTVN